MTLQEQIRANRWRTLWLLLLFALLVGVLGGVLGFVFDPSLLIVVGVVGFVYAIFSWLSRRPHRRRASPAPSPAEKRSTRGSTTCVETVAIAAGLPQPPPVYVVDDPAPERVRRRPQPGQGVRLRHHRPART